MIIKIYFSKVLGVVCISAILMMAFSACDSDKVIEGKAIKGVIVKFERQPYKKLTMEEMNSTFNTGNAPDASGPSGDAGVSTGGPPGRGNGEKAIPAVFIDNGKYLAGKSKADIVKEGKIQDTYVSGLKITGEGDIGGVVVKGIGSEYTISDANIELSGNVERSTEMTAGAVVDDHAVLTIRNSNITSSGTERMATQCTNYSTLKVYSSTLISHGAPFDLLAKPTGPNDASQYLEVKGNSHGHGTMSNSYSYFYYSTIIADGWGAMGTDSAMDLAYIEANHCKIQTVKSGYGAYADWLGHVFLNDCEFDVVSMAAIIAGEADMTFKDTKAKCGTYFALMHCVMGSQTEVGTLKVTGGEIACKSPAVIVKSHNADIKFEDVKMSSESGVLIKSIVNTDPKRTKVKEKPYGIHVTFKDMNVTGDVVHEDPDRIMSVSLESANLKGAIKNSYLTIDESSKWTANTDSNVVIIGNVNIEQIDAPKGVTINAVATENGTYALASGGSLILKMLQ